MRWFISDDDDAEQHCIIPLDFWIVLLVRLCNKALTSTLIRKEYINPRRQLLWNIFFFSFFFFRKDQSLFAANNVEFILAICEQCVPGLFIGCLTFRWLITVDTPIFTQKPKGRGENQEKEVSNVLQTWRRRELHHTPCSSSSYPKKRCPPKLWSVFHECV